MPEATSPKWGRTFGIKRPRLSYIGERLGIDLMTYNPRIMQMYDKFGIRDAPGFTARMVATFGNVRYLDVGAATGRHAEALRKRGIEATACERSWFGRMLAKRRGFPIQPFDLAPTPPIVPTGSYDVAFCLEVAEHIPADLGDKLVDVLCTYPTVVFTAAHPGQGGSGGGTGHINEQPQNYWEERFARHGFSRRRDLEKSMLDAEGEVIGTYLLENLMVYSAQPHERDANDPR